MTNTDDPEKWKTDLGDIYDEVTEALVAVRDHLEDRWPLGAKVGVLLSGRQVTPSAGTIESWDPFRLEARVLLDKPQADKYGFRKFPIPVRKNVHYRNIVA